MLDDILVHGKNQQEHDHRLHLVLQRLQSSGMTLNREKCQFSCHKVQFLGQILDRSGVRPDPYKIKGILDAPTPQNVGDVRRLLGAVNQMSKFSPHLAQTTQPLRELLHKDRAWVWEEPQKSALREVKHLLTSAPVLALFDPSRETVVSADASSYGIGAVLLQRQDDGELKPISYISRSLTTTEQKYAQIEKEALAFTWACERLSDYLLGLHFHIHTDHKLLIPLFSVKNLDELPLRVQRFRLRMMRFSFSISHVPGKDMVVADALSRAPTSDPTSTDQLLKEEAAAYVRVVLSSLPATENRTAEIRECQAQDSVCREVMLYCQTEWPESKSISEAVRPFYHVASELSVEDGLLLRGRRMIIPATLQKEILQRIHTGHLGITKCREHARQSVWWPGLSTQLSQLIKSCKECCKEQSQRALPLHPSPLPDLPFQKVGTDLFEWKKKTYLLIVDYFSRFIEISLLSRTTAEDVIHHMKSIFARHGVPEIVISDNGPQYASEAFAAFAQHYGFTHRTSSPLYPQGNGEAERAVKTVKELLRKGGDPYLALLAHRSSPLQCGYSPSELLMNRKLRTTLPIPRSSLIPSVPDRELLREKDEHYKIHQKQNFDNHHGVRELPQLQPGDAVWLPDRNSEAVVLEQVNHRSYQVQTPEGTYRRNRRALIQLPTPSASVDTEPPDAEHDSNNANSESDMEPQRTSSRQRHPPDRLDPSWT